MQFSALLQSTLLIAFASLALGSSVTPNCVSCEDAGTCAFSTDYYPAKAAIKSNPPNTGYTTTWVSTENKMSVNFSNKKASQVLLRDESFLEGAVYIQFDKKNSVKYKGRYGVSYKVPKEGDCLINYPDGFTRKDVESINTYLKKPQ